MVRFVSLSLRRRRGPLARRIGGLWMVLLASCGGVDSRAVLLDPLDVVLPKGGIQVFVARVLGDNGSGVDWSIDEETRGGRITVDGKYTAPTVEGTYHVVARSHADRSKRKGATVTVTSASVSVSVTPSQARIAPAGIQAFSAWVNNTTNQHVVWSVPTGGGTITSEGVYTAPPASGTYLVTANSEADPSRSGTATATVQAE